MAANGEADDCSGIEAETSFEVNLYIYDLSKELSKSFKKILKGKPLPDIWHTGLVAYGREYYFASSGIESCRPGETILGEPDQILTLGKTELPYSVFLEYIFALGESSYRPGTYNLLEHNCNSFSQEVTTFLTGGPIPQELRELPQEILGNKNLSNTLKEYFDKLSLKVEGSKGISFGSLTGSNPGRRTSTDQQPNDNINGDVIQNGHSSNHQSNSRRNSKSNLQSSEKSSPTTSSNKNQGKKVSKMPAVNGATPTEQKPKQNIADDAMNCNASDGNAKESISSENEQVVENLATAEPPPILQTDSPAAPAEVAAAETPLTSDTASVDTEQAAPDLTPTTVAAGEERTRRVSETEEGDAPLPTFTSRRSKKYQEPPIIFEDVDGVGCHKRLLEIVGEKLNDEEKQAMNELLDYLMSAEGGAWALGAPHLDAIGRLLNDRNLPAEVPVLALRVLQSAALKEDVILLLHQDREHHHVMSFLFRIENLPEDEQEEIATFMCNLCCHTSSFDWLMYISEWTDEGHSCSNSRVTVRVAVHSLLCERPSMQEKGAALIYNLALKELFDDTATELAMAVLQVLQADLNEELAFRNLTALLRFMYISYNDVPALMKMLGPDVRKFLGKSERVDQLVEQIHFKLNVSISA